MLTLLNELAKLICLVVVMSGWAVILMGVAG